MPDAVDLFQALRNKFISAFQVKKEQAFVQIPEQYTGGEKFYCRILESEEYLDWLDKLSAQGDGKMFSKKGMLCTVVACVCDEHGTPLFTEADKPMLGKADFWGAKLHDLARCIYKTNGMIVDNNIIGGIVKN